MESEIGSRADDSFKSQELTEEESMKMLGSITPSPEEFDEYIANFVPPPETYTAIHLCSDHSKSGFPDKQSAWDYVDSQCMNCCEDKPCEARTAEWMVTLTEEDIDMKTTTKLDFTVLVDQVKQGKTAKEQILSYLDETYVKEYVKSTGLRGASCWAALDLRIVGDNIEFEIGDTLDFGIHSLPVERLEDEEYVRTSGRLAGLR